jgi:hypothetical protein
MIAELLPLFCDGPRHMTDVRILRWHGASISGRTSQRVQDAFRSSRQGFGTVAGRRVSIERTVTRVGTNLVENKHEMLYLDKINPRRLFSAFLCRGQRDSALLLLPSPSSAIWLVVSHTMTKCFSSSLTVSNSEVWRLAHSSSTEPIGSWDAYSSR